MSTTSMPTPMPTSMPTWAKAVSVILLLWSLMGVWSFYSELTISPEAAAAMAPAERVLWDSMPSWLWVVFGVAVFSDLAAAICLLMRKAWATPLYLASLAAVIVQFGYIFLVMSVMQTVGAAAIPFPAVIVVVAAISWVLARNWQGKGWLT